MERPVKTSSAAKRPRAGRPSRQEAAQLRERIRQAALECFLQHGFDGTGMEAVAKAAGTTKRTLYAQYPDKRALFATVIPWALARAHGSEQPALAASGELETALTTIARAAVARATDPDIVRLTRMAMAESARFPEFTTSAHSLTWSHRMQAVMELLRNHADRGTVTVDDIEIAAEQFLAMVAALPARLAAFGITREPEVEERHVQHAVTLFLRGALAR